MPSSIGAAAGRRYVSVYNRSSHNPNRVPPDCCSALLRVHLPGYNVIPMELFHPGTGPWVDLDDGRCWHGPIHIVDHLVSHSRVAAPFRFLSPSRHNRRQSSTCGCGTVHGDTAFTQ
jgi:hypothetical protein